MKKLFVGSKINIFINNIYKNSFHYINRIIELVSMMEQELINLKTFYHEPYTKNVNTSTFKNS